MGQENKDIRSALMNRAIDYLGRYSASRRRLGEVLGRHATRRLGDVDPDDIADVIAQVVEECARYGYIDDAVFARTQARNRRRAGQSQLAIRRGLQLHDIGDDMASAALEDADAWTGDGELAAALRHAKKRRLGPYFTGKPDEDTYIKQLGSLARAGFSFDTATAVMLLDGPSEAEERLDELRLDAADANG